MRRLTSSGKGYRVGGKIIRGYSKVTPKNPTYDWQKEIRELAYDFYVPESTTELLINETEKLYQGNSDFMYQKCWARLKKYLAA